MALRKIKSGANGVEIQTQAVGDPAATPALLIMGAAASMLWWPDGLINMIADNGRFVIRYDNRDSGESTHCPPGAPNYGFDDLADDALAVLDAYGLARAQIIGMSMGGVVGQILALRNPDRVAGLVTIGARCFGSLPARPPIAGAEILEHFVARDKLDWTNRAAVEDYIVETWRLNNGPARAFEEDRIRRAARRDVARTPSPESLYNHVMLRGGEDWFDRLSEIRAPVTALHGTDDPVVAAMHAEVIAEAAPKAELRLLQGAGHDLHTQDWPAISRAILEQAERAM